MNVYFGNIELVMLNQEIIKLGSIPVKHNLRHDFFTLKLHYTLLLTIKNNSMAIINNIDTDKIAKHIADQGAIMVHEFLDELEIWNNKGRNIAEYIKGKRACWPRDPKNENQWTKQKTSTVQQLTITLSVGLTETTRYLD